MKTITGVIAVLIALVAIALYSSIFFVHQSQQALLLRFGEPRRIIVEPGLQYKIIVEPGLQYKAPLIDTVILIDKRILDLDNPPQEVIASDQKRLVVDAFARYRITDISRSRPSKALTRVCCRCSTRPCGVCSANRPLSRWSVTTAPI